MSEINEQQYFIDTVLSYRQQSSIFELETSDQLFSANLFNISQRFILYAPSHGCERLFQMEAFVRNKS